MRFSNGNITHWRWWLAGIVAVGSYLRLWDWQSQVLLDDEWHALNFVLYRTFPEVLFQQGLGANSIPVNVYAWLTLHTVGWSEPILRFPSMCAGLLSLIILPLLVKRLWGVCAALIFSILMAVSPVLLFYSRISRPYAMAMLFAVSSVMLTLLWVREGRRRDGVMASLCGAFAVYFHLYAVIPVLFPMAVAVLASIAPVASRLGERVASQRPLRDLLLFAGIMVAVIVPLVLLPNILHPWWTSVHGVDRATFDTALTVSRLLAGTYRIELAILPLVMVCCGMVLMLKRSKIEGAAFVAPFVVFAVVAANTTQEGAHAGIQVARYGIAFFPLAFIAMSLSLSEAAVRLGERLPSAVRPYSMLLLSGVVLGPSIATSPLWRIYDAPNNFTGHSAFQYRYEMRDWSQRSPERDLSPGIYMINEHVSQFYRSTNELKRYKGLIEYPMMVGDHFNLLYYFQHFHRLPVVAGYDSEMAFEPDTPGREAVMASSPVDKVLGSVPGDLKKSMRWRSMVNMNEIERLRKDYRNWLVVIHFNSMRELSGSDEPDDAYVDRVGNRLAAAFGDPVYIDRHLAVWAVR